MYSEWRIYLTNLQAKSKQVKLVHQYHPIDHKNRNPTFAKSQKYLNGYQKGQTVRRLNEMFGSVTTPWSNGHCCTKDYDWWRHWKFHGWISEDNQRIALWGETVVVLDTSHLFGHHILAMMESGWSTSFWTYARKTRNAASAEWPWVLLLIGKIRKWSCHTSGTNEVAGFLEECLCFFFADTTAKNLILKALKSNYGKQFVLLENRNGWFSLIFRGSTHSGRLLFHFVYMRSSSELGFLEVMF